MRVTCDLHHTFDLKDENCQAENCPECGAMTWNPGRPRRSRQDFDLSGIGHAIHMKDPGDTPKFIAPPDKNEFARRAKWESEKRNG